MLIFDLRWRETPYVISWPYKNYKQNLSQSHCTVLQKRIKLFKICLEYIWKSYPLLCMDWWRYHVMYPPLSVLYPLCKWAKTRPVHCLILYAHLALGKSSLCPPFNVYCRILFSRSELLVTWSNHFCLFVFTIFSRSLCGPLSKTKIHK